MGEMNRLELTGRLVRHLTDEIVAPNLGNASSELFMTSDRAQNYYMRSAMGLVSSIGLGMALMCPDRKVVILDGDGSLLMNLGSLTTISALSPRNLIHIVWDNEQYQLTGGQRTHTGRGASLAGIARGAGIQRVVEPRDEDEFEAIVEQALTGDGPWFIVVKTTGESRRDVGPMDPVLIKYNLMRGIGAM